MSIPYMPLYVADYEADTAHLTPEEDGIYMRLLRLCWRTPGCSIPDDAAWISRRLRVDEETFARVVEPLLDEFFQRRNARVFSARLTKEFERIQGTSSKRSEAGKKGGRPRKSLKSKETGKSPAKANEKHLDLDRRDKEPPLTPPSENPPTEARRRGSRLPEDWVLPKAWGEWAVAEGMPAAIVRREAEKFRDYWHGKAGAGATKADWLATWRNWVRKAMERPGARNAPVDDHLKSWGIGDAKPLRLGERDGHRDAPRERDEPSDVSEVFGRPEAGEQEDPLPFRDRDDGWTGGNVPSLRVVCGGVL